MHRNRSYGSAPLQRTDVVVQVVERDERDGRTDGRTDRALIMLLANQPFRIRVLALAVTVGIAASVRVSAEWAVVTNNLYALSHLTCLSLSLSLSVCHHRPLR